MAEKVIIDIEARFHDNVTGKTKTASKALKDLENKAKDAKEEVEDIGKKKINPDVKTTKFMSGMNKIESRLTKLGKGKTSLVLKATDKATAIINKVGNAGDKLASKTYRATVAVRDSGAISTINKIFSGGRNLAGKTWHAAVAIKDMATAPLTKIKNALFSIKSLVLAITAGMAAQQFVMKPIELADAYSGAQIGFSTLLGDTQGQQMMDKLDEFAKATPFNTSDVIANTQKMIAMGWQADNIIDDMRTISDAAAATGKGKEGLDRIVLALAQIRSKGKLSTEELNQLAEAGINAKRYLAEGLGYGSGDEALQKLSKDLEDGAIYSDKAIQALMQGMQEYKGMMESTANETVEGLKSQIKDAFEIDIVRKWGQGLQDGAKRGLGSVVELLDTTESGISKVGDMLYDLGAKISGFVADKFENAIERINKITDTFEFSNASPGEKISMLLKGVIADPLGEWWDANKVAFANKAKEIGLSMGKFLSAGIKGLLGMTDALNDMGLDDTAGESVAKSFARGFVEGFDVSGITQKLVEAVQNVWNALPTWAKILVGGYGVGKVVQGVGAVASGAASIMGAVGSAGTSMVAGSGMLGTASTVGYALTGGAAGSALTGGGAALLGGAAMAGGAAGIASLGKGAYDLYGAYKAHKAGDKTEARAKATSGMTTVSGAAIGAGIGTLIAPGVGTAIGGGIGGILGWIQGGKAAKEIRTARIESEELKKVMNDTTATAQDKALAKQKAIFNDMKKNMGDVKLSVTEINRLAKEFVWGDATESFDKFNAAQKQVESAIQSLNEYGQQTDKWMWKANLGVKFNADEIESITESFQGYIDSAKQLVENKHYEFTAAVDILLDVNSEGGKSILESGNEYFTKIQADLDATSAELQEKLKIYLEDGIIEPNEQADIAKLQQHIAEVTRKVSESEYEAKIDLVKLKFGGGALDSESYKALMEQTQAMIDERMTTNEDAFVVAVSALKLQLKDGALTQEQYNEQVNTLMSEYKATIEQLKVDVMGVNIQMIAESDYGSLLGEDATKKLQTALETALKQNIDPIEWTPDEVRKMLGAKNLSDETALALAEMLSGVYAQLEKLELNPNIQTDFTVTNKNTPTETEQKIKEGLGLPKSIMGFVSVNITGEKGKYKKVDTTKLADELGVPDSTQKSVKALIKGNKKVLNSINVIANDFGIPDSISKTISVGIKAIVSSFTSSSSSRSKKKFRGGIVGGDSGIEHFNSGGMVRGGARLISVAEEGSPEMIIPLSSQRRDRGLKLWAKAGQMMDVPGFARGGNTSSRDEGVRFNASNNASVCGGKGETTVDVGGISVSINVETKEGQSITEAIKSQGNEIAETVAGILADALQAQFENTPSLA